VKFRFSALAVVAGALANVIAPADRILPSVWAGQNLIVPDGPSAGELWSSNLTPYVVEPLDMVAPDSGVNEVAVMKSAQSGFTMMMIAAVGHSIDCDPCRMGFLAPTDSALSEFNREKLQVAIDGSPTLAKKVLSQVSRGSRGSTTHSKIFPGGSLSLILASSGAQLRSKTIKKLFRDEIDEYPDDIDGQGDPLTISDGRYISFLVSGDWKKVDVSTPTIKDGSKIERRYLAGDQRKWHVACPHCRAEGGGPSEFVFEWGSNFRFERSFPHKAHYVAPCCGGIIEAHEKSALVRGGRWIATASRPGAFPSYHFDTMSSPFVPWDHTAGVFIAAGDNPRELQTFWNLWLGLPYELKGDAPDHARLMERRAPGLPKGHIPPRGLMLVASADVQMRGIWFEVIAIAPDRQSWVVDCGYLEGSTESADGGAFEKLEREVLNHKYPDAFGGQRSIDALGVDAGYRSHVVYSWVRNKNRQHPDTGRDLILALDGRDGWGRPAIGTPSLVDINLGGQKVKKGARLWPVGTWPLKGAFYADLAKTGLKGGANIDPEGYCHFGEWLDEVYFRQITAEYLADVNTRGRIAKVWKPIASSRDNHLLDCRVYNLALAEYLGLSSTTADGWADLARRRGMPEASIATGLFAARLEAPHIAGSPAPSPSAAPSSPQAPARPAKITDALAALARMNAT
jgi:phage terminase large subunit GpA-like protein